MKHNVNYKNKFEPLLGKNKFFDRSYYTCYNYLFNNKISLLNKIGFENIHDINVTFIETLALQSQTGTYNFFPFYKLAQCYCSLFRSLLKEKNFSNCIHTAQHIITKLEESNNYFEKYLIQNNRFDSFGSNSRVIFSKKTFRTRIELCMLYSPLKFCGDLSFILYHTALL